MVGTLSTLLDHILVAEKEKLIIQHHVTCVKRAQECDNVTVNISEQNHYPAVLGNGGTPSPHTNVHG